MERAPRGNQLRLTGSACINKVILPLLLRAKLAVPKVNLCKSLAMNADALALLDHTNHQLYGPVHVDTVSRSIKATLTNAGVNTDVFHAHSTRSAPTSTAASKDIPLDIVMKSVYPGRKSSK